ncbi:2OG-Fe(II)oxygenase family Oxidoreductase [Colletotrichum orchidophilum]|uniref:2OG-Fe(II)oxygenase family Oxidoreductase n=1 Tax=Colletotrichum orchidophilum TaxID=1209926 RepID=A0A1G4ARC7_9PEZI|nr:2OG-Fe(II)oxygenase family Oxidoreductase [Colletotrichum orchidophilum]OHE91710.1 2OG-Fe(II)oxygenase family Oxidoreductase [Colletotrichum orchidophilum]
MMASAITKLLGLSAYTALVAISLPYFQQHNIPSRLQTSLNAILSPPADDAPAQQDGTITEPYICQAQNYTTQIISLDPLVIYIHNFLHEADIASLLEAGEPAFKPSYVVKDGRTQGTPDRTSWSAGLPADDDAVQCVLARAEAFLGTVMASGRDEIGPPQLVRYTEGQRFNVHRDWYDDFQPDGMTGRRRRWNRVASFFAILEDGCSGGETWFPEIEAVTPQHRRRDGDGSSVWRRHDDGGVAFRPVRGNAVFWVNLHANGTGDRRVVHAGLPVGDGRKTAMNIWPRRYVGPEAWAEGEGPEDEEGDVVGRRKVKVEKKKEEEEELVIDDAEDDPL